MVFSARIVTSAISGFRPAASSAFTRRSSAACDAELDLFRELLGLGQLDASLYQLFKSCSGTPE